jgi:hypothetical protein
MLTTICQKEFVEVCLGLSHKSYTANQEQAPDNTPVVNGCGCILNQQKWSISSEVMSAAVTVKPTNGPAPTL